jgi:beta-glucosidase
MKKEFILDIVISTHSVKTILQFGYGLSYTTFDISEIKLSSNTFTDKMAVTVTVKNMGKVAGKKYCRLPSAPKKTLTNLAQS